MKIASPNLKIPVINDYFDVFLIGIGFCMRGSSYENSGPELKNSITIKNGAGDRN